MQILRVTAAKFGYEKMEVIPLLSRRPPVEARGLKRAAAAGLGVVAVPRKDFAYRSSTVYKIKSDSEAMTALTMKKPLVLGKVGSFHVDAFDEVLKHVIELLVGSGLVVVCWRRGWMATLPSDRGRRAREATSQSPTETCRCTRLRPPHLLPRPRAAPRAL